MFPNGNVQSPDNYLRPVGTSTFRTGLAPRENQMKRVHSDFLSVLEGTLPKKNLKSVVRKILDGAEDPWILVSSVMSQKGSMDLPLTPKYT